MLVNTHNYEQEAVMSIIQTNMSLEDASRRLHTSSVTERLLSKIKRKKPEYQGTYYYPIFILYARTDIKRALKEWEQFKVLLGVDGIIGRCGLIDYQLPPVVRQKIAGSQVLLGSFDPDMARERGMIYFQHHVQRVVRPSKVKIYYIDKVELAYLPYYVFNFGNKTLTVDTLTGRVDDIQVYPEFMEQFNKIEWGENHERKSCSLSRS